MRCSDACPDAPGVCRGIPGASLLSHRPSRRMPNTHGEATLLPSTPLRRVNFKPTCRRTDQAPPSKSTRWYPAHPPPQAHALPPIQAVAQGQPPHPFCRSVHSSVGTRRQNRANAIAGYPHGCARSSLLPFTQPRAPSCDDVPRPLSSCSLGLDRAAGQAQSVPFGRRPYCESVKLPLETLGLKNLSRLKRTTGSSLSRCARLWPTPVSTAFHRQAAEPPRPLPTRGTHPRPQECLQPPPLDRLLPPRSPPFEPDG